MARARGGLWIAVLLAMVVLGGIALVFAPRSHTVERTRSGPADSSGRTDDVRLETYAGDARAPIAMPSEHRAPGYGKAHALVVHVTERGHGWHGAEVFVDGRSVGATDGTGRLDIAIDQLVTDRPAPWVEVVATAPHRLARRLVAPYPHDVTLELRAAAPPRAFGRVVIEGTLEPALAHDVRVDDVTTTTDGAGRFELALPHAHGQRIHVERGGALLASAPLSLGSEMILAVPATRALDVLPIDPVGVGELTVELHGRRGPNLARVTSRTWAPGDGPARFDAVPESFEGYAVLVHGAGRAPAFVEIEAPHPPFVRVQLEAARARRLVVHGAGGRALGARVHARISGNVAVTESVMLGDDGTAILTSIGGATRVRVELFSAVGATATRLPLVCATVETAPDAPFVIGPLEFVDVVVVAGEASDGRSQPFAFEFEPVPDARIALPCGWGNALGAMRKTPAVLGMPGVHLVTVPRGELGVTIQDPASGAAVVHRIDVREDREWLVPELPLPIEVELVLVRGGAPLVGRRFMVDRPGDDPRTRYGITDERGRARLAFARSGPTRLVVAGDENRVKGSTHTIDIPALGETIVVDVPAPARIEILFGHPAQVHARPLGGLPEFYVGTATLPMHSSVDVVLGANATLALSAGEWDLRIVTADGTIVRRRVELTPGAWERIAPE